MKKTDMMCRLSLCDATDNFYRGEGYLPVFDGTDIWSLSGTMSYTTSDVFKTGGFKIVQPSLYDSFNLEFPKILSNSCAIDIKLYVLNTPDSDVFLSHNGWSNHYITTPGLHRITYLFGEDDVICYDNGIPETFSYARSTSSDNFKMFIGQETDVNDFVLYRSQETSSANTDYIDFYLVDYTNKMSAKFGENEFFGGVCTTYNGLNDDPIIDITGKTFNPEYTSLFLTSLGANNNLVYVETPVYTMSGYVSVQQLPQRTAPTFIISIQTTGGLDYV